MRSTTNCPHCGKQLEQIVAEIGGKRIATGVFSPCDCPAAMRERKDEEAKRHAENEAKAMQVLAAKSRIPKRYREATDPRAPQLASIVEQGGSLYLTGGVGAGKTHLACAVGMELLRRGKRVRFASMLGILDEIKAGFRDETDPLPAYKSAPVLILDDLGKGSQTDFALERLFALVDHRNANMLPIIVTTQYQPSELIAHMASSKGDKETAIAIVSRIRQDSEKVVLSSSDRRQSWTA